MLLQTLEQSLRVNAMAKATQRLQPLFYLKQPVPLSRSQTCSEAQSGWELGSKYKTAGQIQESSKGHWAMPTSLPPGVEEFIVLKKDTQNWAVRCSFQNSPHQPSYLPPPGGRCATRNPATMCQDKAQGLGMEPECVLSLPWLPSEILG